MSLAVPVWYPPTARCRRVSHWERWAPRPRRGRRPRHWPISNSRVRTCLVSFAQTRQRGERHPGAQSYSCDSSALSKTTAALAADRGVVVVRKPIGDSAACGDRIGDRIGDRDAAPRGDGTFPTWWDRHALDSRRKAAAIAGLRSISRSLGIATVAVGAQAALLWTLLDADDDRVRYGDDRCD